MTRKLIATHTSKDGAISGRIYQDGPQRFSIEATANVGRDYDGLQGFISEQEARGMLRHWWLRKLDEINGVGVLAYHPEMGEAKPVAQIAASLGHYGKHYYLYTELELPTSRSVKFIAS